MDDKKLVCKADYEAARARGEGILILILELWESFIRIRALGVRSLITSGDV